MPTPIAHGRSGGDLQSRPALWYVCGALLWLIDAALADRRFGASGAGDLATIYQAGRNVLHHRPIYAGGAFVYPPFMAVAISPLSLLRWTSVVRIWGVAQVIVPLLACVVMAAFTLPRRYWLIASGVWALVLLKADVFADSLFLFNPSIVFVLPAVLTAGLWTKGRWTSGAIVLGASVALKPVLILLFVIPLAVRVWRSAALGVAVAAALTSVGLVVGSDLHGFLRLPGQIASGTTLHGAGLVDNVNLASVGQVHPGLGVLADGARVLVVVGFVAMTWVAARRPLCTADLFVLAGGLALVLPLAGSLDEIHYSLLALPAIPFVVWNRNHLAGRMLGVAGLIVLAIPVSDIGLAPLSLPDAQVRWCLGQLLVFFSCCILLLRADRPLAWATDERDEAVID